MKARIALEKAGEAEAVGTLAGSRREAAPTGLPFTAGQMRALCEIAATLFQIAREAGAQTRPAKVGDVSFELEEDGGEEILYIRKAVAS